MNEYCKHEFAIQGKIALFLTKCQNIRLFFLFTTPLFEDISTFEA